MKIKPNFLIYITSGKILLYSCIAATLYLPNDILTPLYPLIFIQLLHWVVLMSHYSNVFYLIEDDCIRFYQGLNKQREFHLESHEIRKIIFIYYWPFNFGDVIFFTDKINKWNFARYLHYPHFLWNIKYDVPFIYRVNKLSIIQDKLEATFPDKHILKTKSYMYLINK